MAAPVLNALAGLRKMEAEEDDNNEDENTDDNNENKLFKHENETSENTADVDETIVEDVQNSQDQSDSSNTEKESLLIVSKPLKSILKKRKLVEDPAHIEEDVTITKEEPAIEKPKFGGSISLALKMIKGGKQRKPEVPEEKKEIDTGPKPSAFILEMEKQKEQLQSSFQYTPNGVDVDDDDMEWEGSSSPQERDKGPYSFFLQEQQRIKEKKTKKKKVITKPFMISKPPAPRKEEPVTNVIEKAVTSPQEKMDFVVLITNLPFKVTKHELMVIMGIWPKGGYSGLKLITDSSATPSGHAYVILSRHGDMMQLLRLSGLEMQGRKMKVTMSNQKNLIEDWKSTKKALAYLNKSRVVRVWNLSYNLKKSKLIETIPDVKISIYGIHWKPLKEGQENSGRGYIVLDSSEDAKEISKKEYHAEGRKIEIVQVHENEMKKFCKQCDINISEDLILTDPCNEADFDDIDDLDLNRPDGPGICQAIVLNKSPMEKSLNSRCVVMEDLENVTIPPTRDGSKPVKKNFEERKRVERKRYEAQRNQRHRSPERGGPPGPNLSMPPFNPTPFVRMYDVPDKATTADIRIFFEPILPAKIAQNIGYDIVDVEFYNPDDAWNSMKKHMLMMRKNVIKLEMLPGPPRPLPPRPIPQDNTRPAPMMHPAFGPCIMHPHDPGPPGVDPNTVRSGPSSVPFPGMVPSQMHPFASMVPRMVGPPGHIPFPPPHPGMMPIGPRPMMVMPPIQPYMISGSGPVPIPNDANLHQSIDPQKMPPPMHGGKTAKMAKCSNKAAESLKEEEKPEPQKELIPVPPLPENIATYDVPPFNKDTPVGQGTITPMQGYFCQLCNKFYSSRSSAKVSHCKSKGHYDRLKQFLQEKKKQQEK